ncbi:MAG: FAD-dependent oxidoreductase [Nibricoccus sp.]
MNTQTHYDVVIIGAGMSGLAAGIRLAHFGKRVCIFERHNAVGGNLTVSTVSTAENMTSACTR